MVMEDLSNASDSCVPMHLTNVSHDIPYRMDATLRRRAARAAASTPDLAQTMCAAPRRK